MLPHGLCEARAFVDANAVCCDCRGYFSQISQEINSFQLKPEGGSSVSSLVRAGGQPGAQAGEPPQVAQVLHIPVDQKLAPHDINKVTGDNMVSTQVVISHFSTFICCSNQCWSELFELFNYSNSKDPIVVFGICIQSIFKTQIYSEFSIRCIFRS